jgi:hypothetical protein
MVTQAAPVLETEGRTVASYFDSLGPGPPWEELVGWPPGVFALANLVLDHAEAYRFVRGRHWNSPADGPCGIELEPRAANRGRQPGAAAR